jgi:hypothetical protein
MLRKVEIISRLGAARNKLQEAFSTLPAEKQDDGVLS